VELGASSTASQANPRHVVLTLGYSLHFAQANADAQHAGT